MSKEALENYKYFYSIYKDCDDFFQENVAFVRQRIVELEELNPQPNLESSGKFFDKSRSDQSGSLGENLLHVLYWNLLSFTSFRLHKKKCSESGN